MLQLGQRGDSQCVVAMEQGKWELWNDKTGMHKSNEETKGGGVASIEWRRFDFSHSSGCGGGGGMRAAPRRGE